MKPGFRVLSSPKPVRPFGRSPFLRCQPYLPLPIVRAFARRFRLGLSVAPPFGLECLTSFADSTAYYACAINGTWRRPPQVSSIAFTAPPPDLQPWPLMEPDFAIRCPLVRPRMPNLVSVRQVAALLRTSFRRHLAMTPLCPSPPSGWTGDSHSPAIEQCWAHNETAHAVACGNCRHQQR